MSDSPFTEQFVIELAKRSYEDNARFEIAAEHCALLVIDMQDEFVKPGWTPYWVPEATRQVPRIKALIDFCRARNIPIIFTDTVTPPTHHDFDQSLTGPMMANRYPDLDVDQTRFFVEGRIWHELELQKQDVIIHKAAYGAFYDTPLETILKNLRKDTVIICGTLTNYCCGMTARQAQERSFKVVFGSDVNATDDPDQQAAELKTLRRGFAKVLTAAEIMAALGGQG